MPVMTVEHKGNYTVVSNELIRDSNLSLKAKGMMLLVLSLPPVWEFTIEGMTEICKEGKDSIQKTFCELEKYGYLKRNRTRTKGKLAGIEYNFFEEPKPDNPYEVSPHPGKPDEENPSQLNKDLLSKEELIPISKEIGEPDGSQPKKKKKSNSKKKKTEEPTEGGKEEILCERSDNKEEPTTPQPPAARRGSYPAVMAYIDSLPHPDSFKAALKKWYDACGRGKINDQQLKDKLKTAYVECGKDIAVLERSVNNAYENGYRAFYAPKEGRGYKNTPPTPNVPQKPSEAATEDYIAQQLELGKKMLEKLKENN